MNEELATWLANGRGRRAEHAIKPDGQHVVVLVIEEADLGGQPATPYKISARVNGSGPSVDEAAEAAFDLLDRITK